MTGKQLKIQGIGSTNEAFCEAMLGRIAAMVPVPREHDYGIDFYCLPRRELTAHSETVAELAAIQVKGASTSAIVFGGTAPKSSEWRRYELDWLRTLRIPLYLASVDAAYERVNLYSLTRCLQVFLKTPFPYAIECETSPLDLNGSCATAEPQPTPTVTATPAHDGATWNVQLGIPFLTLKFSELDDSRQREWVTNVFLQWIAADSHTLGNLAMGVPVVRLAQNYYANIPPTYLENIMFWYPDHDGQARDMSARLAPGLASVARQLLSEGRSSEAKAWGPALEWCRAQAVIDKFGADVADEIAKLP